MAEFKKPTPEPLIIDLAKQIEAAEVASYKKGLAAGKKQTNAESVQKSVQKQLSDLQKIHEKEMMSARVQDMEVFVAAKQLIVQLWMLMGGGECLHYDGDTGPTSYCECRSDDYYNDRY